MRHPLTLALLLALAAAPARAQDALEIELQKGASDVPANRVLHLLQAGTIALDMGRTEDAGRLFDEALVGINAVYANSEQAAKARSLWQNEGSKDYKGEPYERAMAHYYRAIVDMMDGDYENARAGFKSALIQDALAEEDQHKADFGLMVFLEGWCSHVLGAKSLADEAFTELERANPNFRRPPPDHKVLVLVETGKAPRKLQDGIGGNILVYRPGKRFTEVGAQARVRDATLPLQPMESIYFQATTRGGRAIDSILDGKVQLKQNTQSVAAGVSGIANELGVYAPLYGASNAGFAAVAGIAGLASLATSGVKARADNRFWNNLPDGVHALTMKADATLTEVAVEFLDKSGSVIPELTQVRNVAMDKKGRGLVWARARRATEVDTK